MTKTLKLSAVGKRMSSLTGVRAIMQDIIETLATGSKDFINLSAGNPVILPKIAAMWKEFGQACINEDEYSQVVGRYGSSKGYAPLIDAIVEDYNARYGLSLTQKNVVITPGSQTIFFLGANAFSGRDQQGVLKKFVLPLLPEYTGYGGITLDARAIVGCQPRIHKYQDNHFFKYLLDEEAISLGADTGCLCVSRPCNPTGNILSNAEMQFLVDKAKTVDVPLFVDAAYAGPYPGLNFEECTPIFDDHVVHCVTLSKAGLPGERLGFAIGHESIIEVIQAFLTNACIHSSRFGQAIAARAIKSQRLQQLCQEEVAPFYKHKFEVIFQAMQEHFPGDLPWRVHKGQGGLFVWLWLEGLPMSDWDFYQQLKKEQVIAVPGSTFFPGLQDTTWKHASECIRISLTASETELVEAMQRIGRLIKRAY